MITIQTWITTMIYTYEAILTYATYDPTLLVSFSLIIYYNVWCHECHPHGHFPR